ncbi:MAG: MYXO-CTERM sorting domain-containing protein [Polyangiaceae bacterium]|nr:MYXO-CTERM sorting domain-containing protein [Polyangiaceae bacterium]
MAGNDGATGQAGSADKGGASGQGAGGQASGGVPVNDAAPEAEGGCGCRTTGGGREGGVGVIGLLALALTARRRSAGGLQALVTASWSRWPGADRAARRR